MATPMALIYKMLFPSISTFETPPVTHSSTTWEQKKGDGRVPVDASGQLHRPRLGCRTGVLDAREGLRPRPASGGSHPEAERRNYRGGAGGAVYLATAGVGVKHGSHASTL